MQASRCAFLDASVIYPASLRDLLMRLTLAGLYQARWSSKVHEEWMRAVLRSRPDLTSDRLQRVREAMDRYAEDAVVTGYEALVPSLVLPDMDDRHVLAAAIATGADVIVTFNLKDFPAAVLDQYQIKAEHPDLFLRHLMDLKPAIFLGTVTSLQGSLKSPPVSMNSLLALFNRIGLFETVKELRRLISS